MSESSTRQQVHYERIHDDYENHYYDATSMAFRERFIYDIMFRGLNLNGKDVADLAAGSGHNSRAVQQRFPQAKVAGFDISPSACESYRRIVGAEAFELDLTSQSPPRPRFDVAMIVGGLHHCVSNLPGTFRTISGLLRPGGLLLMYEPNERYALEALRKLWYRHDRYFDAQTEHALDHDESVALAARSSFVPVECTYGGGPAYFLIYNSMIFRIPVAIKRYMAPPLFALESAYNKLPWKACFPTFIARWQKSA
jgi:SAM-dependent methyltransferase